MKAWIREVSGSWCAFWNDPDGKRRQKAFGPREEGQQKAKAFASSLERMVLEGSYSEISRNEFAIKPIDLEIVGPISSAIYFVEAVGLERVKIGFSDSPRRRLVHLAMSCPVRLRVLAIMSGSRDDEFKLHCKFAGFRLHGEWFQMGKPIRRLIEHLQATNPISQRLLHATAKRQQRQRRRERLRKDSGAILALSTSNLPQVLMPPVGLEPTTR